MLNILFQIHFSKIIKQNNTSFLGRVVVTDVLVVVVAVGAGDAVMADALVVVADALLLVVGYAVVTDALLLLVVYPEVTDALVVVVVVGYAVVMDAL